MAAVIHTNRIHDAEVRQRDGLAGTRPAENISTVATMVLSVCKGKGRPAAHANVRVDPFGRGATVQHATGYVLFGGEAEAFALEDAVDVVDVAEIASPLGGCGPRLDQLEHLAFDVVVRGDCGGRAQQGRHVVEELARGDLLDEVGAAILDASVCEIQRGQLDVWVLVADALLQCAHGIFGLHRLGSNHIGDLEVQRHVLQARGRGALNLLIERARGRGAEPARHDEGRCFGAGAMGACQEPA